MVLIQDYTLDRTEIQVPEVKEVQRLLAVQAELEQKAQLVTQVYLVLEVMDDLEIKVWRVEQVEVDTMAAAAAVA